MTKNEIKAKAEKLAKFLGYETSKDNLHNINLYEMYCQGYLQAIQDHGIPVQVKESGETMNDKIYDDESPDYIKQSQEEI